jgi:hypothetical protein
MASGWLPDDSRRVSLAAALFLIRMAAPPTWCIVPLVPTLALGPGVRFVVP